MVYLQTVPLQLFGYAPVTVSGELERYALDLPWQFLISI
jgi:hypothetical protein